MPRYYFNIYHNNSERDPEGRELPTSTQPGHKRHRPLAKS